MINCYIIEIKGKRLNYFLSKLFKLNINIIDITYKKESIILKVSYQDYQKIKELKTTYKINILGIKGIKKIENIIKKYYIFLIFFITSIVIIYLLSNFIFFINIEYEKKEIVNLIKKELDKNNLKIYTFRKNFKKLDQIKNKIKKDNSSHIEWIEIEQDGISYNIKLIERKQEDIKKDTTPKDIVAKNNGMIINLYSTSGEIIKNVGDYVSKGETIISGTIKRNENISGYTKAQGDVYAETWYKVKLDAPFNYIDEIKDIKGTKQIIIKIFNKEISLFKRKRKIKKEKYKTIFKSQFMTIINKHEYLLKKENKKYTKEELQNTLEELAKDEILKKLKDDEKILYQKTLKVNTISDRMYIEVFFKIYENIAIEKDIIKDN